MFRHISDWCYPVLNFREKLLEFFRCKTYAVRDPYGKGSTYDSWTSSFETQLVSDFVVNLVSKSWPTRPMSLQCYQNNRKLSNWVSYQLRFGKGRENMWVHVLFVLEHFRGVSVCPTRAGGRPQSATCLTSMNFKLWNRFQVTLDHFQ